ncbi:MAG: hypothetical protein ACLFVJ_04485 [Persicimonas sp.]
MPKIIFAMVTAFLCATLSSTAFAADPIICDAEEGADCGCPDDNSTYDACYEVDVSDLTSPDDPEALRELANISSEWNSELGVYEIDVDATALSAGGMMSLHRNNGQWESFEELYDYVERLTGADLYNVCNPDDLFPFSVRQNGRVTRYDQFAQEWAMSTVDSLIWGSVTSSDGQLVVGDIEFDPIFAAGESCPGISQDAYETEVEDDLVSHQCSMAGKWEEDNPAAGLPEDPCYPKENEKVTHRHASTLVEASRPKAVGEPERICQGTIENGDFHCTQEDQVIHILRKVEHITLGNQYFQFEQERSSDFEHLQDVSELYLEDSINDGVCGHGTVNDGEDSLVMDTRDGAFDPYHPDCDF